jgi:hypothetical protein
MMALMESLHAEKSGGWARGGDGAFAFPVESVEVVRTRFDGTLADIVAVGGNVVVEQSTSKFQFGVVESATRVAERYQVTPDVIRKGKAPDNGGSAV